MKVQTAHFSRVPGGTYECRKNADGTWDILDVEFFSTIPKGVKGAPKDITEEDLQASVEVHQAKFTNDRFLARLNVLHNYGNTKATGAGFFLPKRVARMNFGGKSRPVVFCDLISVSESVLGMIQRNELPYRSAEVREWEPLQFGALALLDTEPPFFEFPLLSGASVDTAGESESVGHEIFRFRGSSEPAAVAAFTSNEGSSFLFKFAQQEDSVDDDKKNEEAQMMDEDESGGMQPDDIVKAIESGEIAVKDFDAITAAIEARTGAAPAEEVVEEPEELEPASQDIPVELSDDEDPDKATADIKMAGRLAALEDKVAEQERKEQTKALFSAAVKGLEDDGFNVSDASRDRLFKAADAGEDTLALFVEGYRETTPRDPGPSLDGGGPSDESYPSEVMAFANQGPDVFATAKAEFRAWEELKNSKTFGATVSPLDKFLARNVRKGG